MIHSPTNRTHDMDQNPVIYHSNGAFLIFDTRHALQLRRRRIISQFLSDSPASGPHCLSPYAAYVVALEGLASFCQLQQKEKLSIDENRSKFELKMKEYTDKQRELFRIRRISDLERHNIDPTPITIGEFDDTKLRLITADTPDSELTSFDAIAMRCDEVTQIVAQQVKPDLRHVMFDLYKRGFYVTSGMKFGCDFLAYVGDPVRYHAQYAIKQVQCNDLGSIDLERVSFRDINSLQRLLHSANKVPLLVTVRCDGNHVSLRYWTMSERVYLTPESDNSIFKSIEPCSRGKAVERDLSCNKIMRRT